MRFFSKVGRGFYFSGAGSNFLYSAVGSGRFFLLSTGGSGSPQPGSATLVLTTCVAMGASVKIVLITEEWL